MTQKSILWETQTATGDGSDSYAESEANELLTGHEYDPLAPYQGVLADDSGRLEVSGVQAPLTVQDGRAYVHYFRYRNFGNLTIPVETPSADTGYRVVLQANWVTNKVRATLTTSGDGNVSIPDINQSVGSIWEIPLASFVMDSDGVIWTDATKSTVGVSDDRQFLVSKLAGLIPIQDFLMDGSLSEVSFTVQTDVSEIVILGSLRTEKANTAEAYIGIAMDAGGTFTYMDMEYLGDGSTDATTPRYNSGKSTAQFIPMPAQDAPDNYFGTMIIRIPTPGESYLTPVFVQAASIYGESADDCRIVDGFLAMSGSGPVSLVRIYADAPFSSGSRISVFALR